MIWWALSYWRLHVRGYMHAWAQSCCTDGYYIRNITNKRDWKLERYVQETKRALFVVTWEEILSEIYLSCGREQRLVGWED